MTILAKVLVVLAVIASMLGGSSAAANSNHHVVINEIHYHPPGDDDDQREFLEIHNPGDAPVDMSGMVFTDGITTDPLDGIVVPAGGYVVLAPVENATFETYGVTPAATYTGLLKNGGETIELSLDGTIIDVVTYDDDPDLDWPIEPDGNGSSLELTDAEADNDNGPANWHSSAGDPTPGTANSVPVPPPFVFDDVSVEPRRPSSTDPISVATTLENAQNVTLTYRIGFEQPVSVPMSQQAGNRYITTIPPQAPGTLVRYRIDTAEGISFPAAADSIDYVGVVVADPSVTTGGAPVFEWFIDEPDYDRMLGDRLNRDISVPAVLAYDGVVYDNVRVEIRGGIYGRTNSPKQSFNFDMPSGHDFDAPDLLDYPMDEFAIQGEFGDELFGRAESSWWFFQQAGFPNVHSFGFRLQRNGEFYGIYRFQEKLDGTWRSQTGYDDGEFYKADLGGFQSQNGFDKKQPDDGDVIRINAVAAALDLRTQSGRTGSLYDNFDVPALINYAASIAIVGHDDSKYHNFYAHFDSDGDERWSMLHWDLDVTFGFDVRGCEGLRFTTLKCLDDDLMNAIYEDPDLYAMYWARVKTLTEQVLAQSTIDELHDERIALIGPEVGALEVARWDRDVDLTAPSSVAAFHRAVQARRDAFANEPLVPELGQPTDIVISEILAAPVDGAPETLELVNVGDAPVDLSGWKIDAVFKKDATMPQGAIILPGSRMLLTDSIGNVDRTYPNLPNTVMVQYNGGLSSSGEKIELVTPNGVVADMVEYNNSDPWPTDLGEAFSIELKSLASDNAAAENWGATTTEGGTPGRRNSLEPFDSTRLSVFAKGSTGEEVISVTINGTMNHEFAVSTNTREYQFTSDEPVTDVRVSFINDRSSPLDRNVFIDAIEVGGDRYEAEASDVESVGSWSPDGGCGRGFKGSETLHCNGHFDFVVASVPNPVPGPGPGPGPDPGPDPDPDPATTEVAVITWGVTGEEIANLIINGSTTYEINVTDSPAEYVFSFDGAVSDVRVSFVNDRSRPVDRNLFVDAIIVDGERHEAEASDVESVGSWSPVDGCGRGFKGSQKLHCNGHFDFVVASVPNPGPGPVPGPDPGPDPATTEVAVITWGVTGEEIANLIINGSTTYEINVTDSPAEYVFSFDGTVSDVRVSFVNDRSSPVDRNLFVDAVIVDGERYESEAPDVLSVGSWNGANGCAAGFKRSQKLHCNGHFQYTVS